MSTPRLAVALAAAFFASTASVWPTLHLDGPPKSNGNKPAAARLTAPETRPMDWPPPALGTRDEPADIAVRFERTSNGSRRLVVEKTGTFMHLQYREVASAGPDWASIELRSGDRAPKDDVAVWESTDPVTLATTRGTVRFSLASSETPRAVLADAPRPGPRDGSSVRTCQSFEDGDHGFAVVCSIAKKTSGVRAIRPTSQRPLDAAWVWDVPAAAKRPASRFVRFDLPLTPGGAESGAIAYVLGGSGVVARADASWPSRAETPTLLFTESSRKQPLSPTFSWR